MSFFGKLYTVYKDENFDGLLKTLGLPDDKIQLVLAEKSTLKLSKNGDSYVLSLGSSKGSSDKTFKAGVEFDDVMGPTQVPVKATVFIDGNSFTQKIKTEKGEACVKGEFNGDELVVSITSTKFDGVAKRYFKA